MNEEVGKGRRIVPSLPATPAEWDAARKIKHERTLNDHVEDLHRTILSDDKTLVPTDDGGQEKRSVKYERLLDAVFDEDAVEGSLSTDNVMAAMLIRGCAHETIGDGALRDHYVADKKLATIVKSLGVVMRRYGNSRAERARRVGGEIVPNDNGAA